MISHEDFPFFAIGYTKSDNISVYSKLYPVSSSDSVLFPQPPLPERAFQLFEKAANANIPAAQYNLSILYRYGEGVEKDIDLADTWRMKAAQNGFKLAIEEIHKEVGIE